MFHMSVCFNIEGLYGLLLLGTCPLRGGGGGGGVEGHLLCEYIIQRHRLPLASQVSLSSETQAACVCVSECVKRACVRVCASVCERDAE